MKIDYKIAMAAGQDAGNRNANKNNQQAWNEEDWNIAAEAFNKLNNFDNARGMNTSQKANGARAFIGYPLTSLRPSQGSLRS